MCVHVVCVNANQCQSTPLIQLTCVTVCKFCVCVCSCVCVCVVCVLMCVDACVCVCVDACVCITISMSVFAQLEESEDHLRDSLAHTNAERDELLQRVDSLQSTVTAHEEEIE